MWGRYIAERKKVLEEGFNMNYQTWKDMTFANVLEYNMLAVEMTEDLVAQLSSKGGRIHRSLPVNYKFGAIIMSADGAKFLQVNTDDLREGSAWFNNVKLYEMTDRRVPEGEEPHICSWDKIGEEAAKYLC